MSFSPINPQKISDTIVSYIEDLILNGVLKPGDKMLSERDLAKELDVSRTSLRDAMVKLEARGLIQARHSGGTFIKDIIGPTLTDPLVHLLAETPDAMLDLFEVREALEKVAAYSAAERSTAPDREIIRERFTALNTRTETGDPCADATAIAEYYLAIADASHNIALMHVMRGLFNLMRTSVARSLETIYAHPGTYEIVHGHREEMHEAILAGDPDAAVQAANAVIIFLHRTFRELNIAEDVEAEDSDNDAFKPVDTSDLKPSRLSDAVVSQIEKQIMSGKLKASDQLPPEQELADQLQVSRAVLRDAVVRLEARGVLHIKRGGGTFVCDVPGPTINDPLVYLLQSHPDAVFDFLHLRGSLEELCAYYAAERRNERDLAKLHAVFADIESCVTQPDPYCDAEKITDFHTALAEASHNVALVYIIRGLYSLLRTSIRHNLERMHSEPNNYELVLEHHRDILSAVENKDVDQAASAARIHINFVNDSLSQLGAEQKRLELSQRRVESIRKMENAQPK